MRLIDLQLQNYRKYREAELAFGEGLIGIIGPNGTGKSSLVEAIAWAIFGQDASRTDKQLIPRQNMPKGEPCQVILTLDINQKEYRIVRQLSGTSLAGKAAVFSKDNGVTQQVASGTAPTTSFLTGLLGMDRKSFFTSFFAKQQELNTLSDERPSERRKIILNMLGITNIDKALDLVRFDKRGLENKAQLLDSNKADGNFLKVRFQSLSHEYKEKNGQLSKIRRNLVSQRKEAAKAEREAKSLAAKREQYMVLSMQKHGLASDLSSAQENLQSLKELRAKLSQEVSLSDRPKSTNKKTAFDLQGLEAKIKTLAEKEAALNEQINKLEAKKQGIADKANLAKAHLQTEQNNLDELQKKMKNIQSAETDNCPFCGQSLDKTTKEEVLAHHKTDAKKIEDAIKQKDTFIKQSRQEYLLLDKKHVLLKNDLSKVQRELDKDNAKIEQFSNLEQQLGSLAEQAQTKQSQTKDIKEQIAKNDRKIKELAFDEKTFNIKSAEAKGFTERLHKSELEFKDIDKEISLTASNLEQLKSEIEKTKSIKEQLLDLNKKKNNLAKLERLFADFRRDLIGRIRPSLSKKAGDYLNELTDGKYSRVELDKNYDIYVYDSGEKFSIERFSGGETDLVNLCLRLAISELLTERAGSEFNFLVLDEIFGSQDSGRRDNILKALVKLSKKFRQLLVITHIDELKDSMESLISLKEENGTTIIEQN